MDWHCRQTQFANTSSSGRSRISYCFFENIKTSKISLDKTSCRKPWANPWLNLWTTYGMPLITRETFEFWSL